MTMMLSPCKQIGDYNMNTIVIITYKSGVKEARFITDAELLDIIIDGFDYIEDIEQVEFTGTIPTLPAAPQLTDERVIRNTVRKIGKVATKRLME